MRMLTTAVLLASAAALPAAAAGFELPPRKPGQWEMSIQVDTAAMPPQVIRMCLDAETDKLLNEKFSGMASNMCSKQEQTKDGDAIVLDSVCQLGDMKSESHSVVTGDFDSAYTMKTDMKMSGSNAPNGVKNITPGGPMTQQTTLNAKRTGECEAAMKPGDIDLGGGRVLNVRDMPSPNIQ
ncbi:hypothetical protein JOD31_001360 [Methylopila capsulata]|uniref:DUF3617 family protein n=1 Tax=Methylopila capsulata TaxID=61654 RepID=A0A9W6MQG6_9HYPH|nr:DUF3617 family protein [Methylopila capsulata]MBM7851135.1 hypothetical protein [Methylopila capsulata]GLK54192.1 hypothetical protein GCM10008170_02110 [Methylopila capsulata]